MIEALHIRIEELEHEKEHLETFKTTCFEREEQLKHQNRELEQL